MTAINDSDSPSNTKRNVSFTGAKMDWMTAAAYDRRLKPSDFRVAFVIAQHVNEKTGKAYPTEELIADRIGTSVRTVMRSVGLLQEHGWLRIKRKRTYDPKNKTWKTRNIYWLRFDNVQIVFDAITASKIGRRFKRDTDVTLKRDTSVTLTPSEKHLQKGGESTEGGKRVLPLMRVVGGGRS
jgi:hypothetical protein